MILKFLKKQENIYRSNKVMMIEIYLFVGNKKKNYAELKDDRKYIK